MICSALRHASSSVLRKRCPLFDSPILSLNYQRKGCRSRNLLQKAFQTGLQWSLFFNLEPIICSLKCFLPFGGAKVVWSGMGLSPTRGNERAVKMTKF